MLLQAAALDRLGEGVLIMTGPDWLRSKIVFVNDAICRITGYGCDELIGRPRSILNGKNTQQARILNRITKKLSAGKSTKARLVEYGKGARPYRAEVSVTALWPSQNGTLTFICIHRDITKRVETERKLVEYQKNLRRVASELTLAEAQERQRLAEDLHDSFGPLLFRLQMIIDRLHLNEPDTKEARAVLREAAATMNALTTKLSPVVLDKLGLRHALRSLVTEMQQQYGLTVAIDDDGSDLNVDRRMSFVLFRSVRELLINVAKHAETAAASVKISRTNTSLQIDVTDGGKGFDPDDSSGHVQAGHFGLFSIRERLEYLGGNCRIVSAKGAGTSATLTAPIARSKTANAL